MSATEAGAHAGCEELGLTAGTWYAVAVRDGADLWLFLRLLRARHGDVYAFWGGDELPHASLHASGQRHIRGFRRRQHQRGDLFLIEKGPPLSSLVGCRQPVSTPIALMEVRQRQRSCAAKDFSGGVFMLDASEIAATRPGRTALAIDLSEQGAPPLIHPPNSPRCSLLVEKP